MSPTEIPTPSDELDPQKLEAELLVFDERFKAANGKASEQAGGLTPTTHATLRLTLRSAASEIHQTRRLLTVHREFTVNARRVASALAGQVSLASLGIENRQIGEQLLARTQVEAVKSLNDAARAERQIDVLLKDAERILEGPPPEKIADDVQGRLGELEKRIDMVHGDCAALREQLVKMTATSAPTSARTRRAK